jgi:hypothetical protein
MVDEQLEQLREQRAAWAPVELVPQAGDQVTLDLSVQEGDAGESGALEMSAPQQFQVVVGQGQAIPAVEALILQAAPGETVEQDVTWPDDFPVVEERGKSKRVRVHVKEVKRKALPALDDDLARELGRLRLARRAHGDGARGPRQQLARETDAEARAKLLDAIIDANPFDVPPSWVNQLVQSYAQAYQIPEQDLQRFAGEFRPLAERQVRRDLVVDTIAKRENLQATAADVDAEVETLARSRNQEPGQLYASLQKANRLGEIEHGVTERKVFEWLRRRNTTREVGPAARGAPDGAAGRGRRAPRRVRAPARKTRAERRPRRGVSSRRLPPPAPRSCCTTPTVRRDGAGAPPGTGGAPRPFGDCAREAPMPTFPRSPFLARDDDEHEPMPTIYTPYIIERSSRGERTYDIFSRLLMDRIIFLGTPINDDVANVVISQLLFLESDNPGRTSTCTSTRRAAR